MPDLDDYLRRELKRAARHPDRGDIYEHLARRRTRRAIARKAETGLLAVSVVAGTLFGTIALDRAFRTGAGIGGQVAFTKTLRACPGHPNVDGPDPDVFTVDVATGEERGLAIGAHMQRVQSHRGERWPSFSPDGTRYAWVDRYLLNLYVSDVATGGLSQLTDGLAVGPPDFSPDGSRIVFAAGDGEEHDLTTAIYVVNADGTGLTKLTRGGDASDSMPTWSPDGQRIAFVRQELRSQQVGGTTSYRHGPQTFFTMEADGSNVELQYTSVKDVQVLSGEWSPDGTKFVGDAIVRGNRDIYLVDTRTRAALRLTDDPAPDSHPTWSPDGTKIAFQTGRWRTGEGSGYSEIAMMDADGSNVVRLTNDCWDDFDPTWVPDAGPLSAVPTWTPPPLPDLGPRGTATPGQILVDDEIDGVFDIYAVDPETGTRTNLTADLANDQFPTWSPDGTRIAWGSDRDEDGNFDIYVMSADGTGITRLTSDPASDVRPSWSPDGARIAFESHGDIWVMEADGSDREQITSGAGRDAYASWSPDGARIAFVRDGFVHVMDADGSNIHRLTDTVFDEEHPEYGDCYETAWSPDGMRLLFTRGRNIWAIDPDGSNLVNLTGGPRDTYERGADWSPDGSQIVFVRAGVNDRAFHLFVMDADGSNARRVSDLSMGFGFCCPEPDW
jgi:Tol biopolymer transport system component